MNRVRWAFMGYALSFGVAWSGDFKEGVIGDPSAELGQTSESPVNADAANQNEWIAVETDAWAFLWQNSALGIGHVSEPYTPAGFWYDRTQEELFVYLDSDNLHAALAELATDHGLDLLDCVHRDSTLWRLWSEPPEPAPAGQWMLVTQELSGVDDARPQRGGPVTVNPSRSQACGRIKCKCPLGLGSVKVALVAASRKSWVVPCPFGTRIQLIAPTCCDLTKPTYKVPDSNEEPGPDDTGVGNVQGTIQHECMHACQIKRVGWFGFSFGYLWEFVRCGGVWGCISQEIEAEQWEDLVGDDWGDGDEYWEWVKRPKGCDAQ